MNRRIQLILITLTAIVLACPLGCKPPLPDEEPLMEDSLSADVCDSLADSVDDAEWDNWMDAYQEEEEHLKAEQAAAMPQQPQPVKKATPQQTQSKNAAATHPLPNGKKIYVSTYGAQGQVWGYVVMNGNSGSGTIHDAEENTLTIRVTRHGNELFGTDQNSRQYVFKI